MRWSLLAATGLLTLLLCRSVYAQRADLSRIVLNLKHEDFRVRTQAALALGASKDVRAEAPLCRALSDSSVPVRAAAAAGLGRRASGGLACLERRYPVETSAAVKLAIERAAELVFGGFRIRDETRFYIAIAPVSDQANRPTAGFPQLARDAMLTAGRALPEVAFAPAWETLALARKRLASRGGLKAFSLSPRLPPFEYAGGNLTALLEIVMLTYPENALIGSFTVRLTQSDVDAPDLASEKDLVKMAAERAVQKFAKLAPGL